MLDINWIRANRAAFDKAAAGRKNVPFTADELLALDDQRKSVIASVEDAQAKRNALSKQIGQAKAQKDEAKANELMAEVASLKDTIQSGEDARRKADEALRNALLVMPNLPLEEVPVGADEHDNVEYYGPNRSPTTAAAVRPAKPSFSFKPKEHYETGEALGQMDFEVAARLSGSRFVVLKSQLARLERAIGQFMLDLHVDEHGYTEVLPPLLVKDDALFGTNQLPKFEEDLFFVPHGDGRLALIPTAEVPLTNLVRESILAEDELPLRFHQEFVHRQVRVLGLWWHCAPAERLGISTPELRLNVLRVSVQPA